MKPRSKKYYQRRKEGSGEKKGPLSEADYNEENRITSKQPPKKNPAPPNSKEDPLAHTLTSQGDIVVEKNEPGR
jgi:hypothetical protein